MTARADSYHVEHNWGDPREPEYQNGLVVSYAYYKEGSIFLRFRLVGLRCQTTENTKWTVEAPPDMRERLGPRWTDRETIFRRVTKFLERIPASDLWRIGSLPYRNLTIDASKVRGWFATKRKDWLAPKLRLIPGLKVAPFLAIGLGAACFHYWHRPSAQPSWASSLVLVLSALIALALQLQEASKHYKAMALLAGVTNFFSKPRDNNRASALVMTMRYWGFRYATTAALSILLIWVAAR